MSLFQIPNPPPPLSFSHSKIWHITDDPGYWWQCHDWYLRLQVWNCESLKVWSCWSRCTMGKIGTNIGTMFWQKDIYTCICIYLQYLYVHKYIQTYKTKINKWMEKESLSGYCKGAVKLLLFSWLFIWSFYPHFYLSKADIFISLYHHLSNWYIDQP